MSKFYRTAIIFYLLIQSIQILVDFMDCDAIVILFLVVFTFYFTFSYFYIFFLFFNYF